MPAREPTSRPRRSSATPDRAGSLLRTWFGDALETPEQPARLQARIGVWFSVRPDFDRSLREPFSDLPDRALRGELAGWRDAPRSCLALVVALDQLPRNLFRGSPRAFAYDPAATREALAAIDRGFDRELHPVECAFLYLPLEHAEDRELQARSVEQFRALVERAPPALRPQFESFLAYAERHRVVIDRFGRFPHRNAALGRPSTPEEERYLSQRGETFGGSDSPAQP